MPKLRPPGGDIKNNTSNVTAMMRHRADNDVLEYDAVESANEDLRENALGAEQIFRVNSLLRNRYHVLKKIGSGVSSSVYLSWDLERNEFVAIKLIKSSPRHAQNARHEIDLLNYVWKKNPTHIHRRNVVTLIDTFTVLDVRSRPHMALVLEYMKFDLMNLLQESNYSGILLSNVKSIIYEILKGLDYLHNECNVMHLDVKLQNVLYDIKTESSGTQIMAHNMENIQILQDYVQTKQAVYLDYIRNEAIIVQKETTTNVKILKGKLNLGDLSAQLNPVNQICEFLVKLGDLGNSSLIRECKIGALAQTRPYRCPEIILGSEYGAPADMWSVACLAYELATGQLLFNCGPHEDEKTDRKHLGLMMEFLGPFPKSIALSGLYSSTFFNDKGDLKYKKHIRRQRLCELLRSEYQWKSKDAKEFEEFLSIMLVYDPKNRATAGDVLHHRWFSN